MVRRSRHKIDLQALHGLSADTALRLARWMGTSPQFWMNLQRNYELRLAEQEHGDEIRERVRPRTEAA